MDKKIVSDKSVLFALNEPKLHYIKVAEDKDEYLERTNVISQEIMKINPK